jgi:hypothetical protein
LPEATLRATFTAPRSGTTMPRVMSTPVSTLARMAAPASASSSSAVLPAIRLDCWPACSIAALRVSTSLSSAAMYLPCAARTENWNFSGAPSVSPEATVLTKDAWAGTNLARASFTALSCSWLASSLNSGSSSAMVFSCAAISPATVSSSFLICSSPDMISVVIMLREASPSSALALLASATAL